MNKLTLGLTLLLTYGCSQPILNSRSVIAPGTTVSGCSETFKVNLNQQNITEVGLNEQTLVKSGRVTATEAVGYRFDAESGQILTYTTNDDICIVVYTPDNRIISSGKLPVSGKYILEVSAPQNHRVFGLGMSLYLLQVSAPQGIRAFNLSMSLTTPQPIAVNPPPTPTPTPVQTQQPRPQPPRVSPRRVSQPVHNISEDEALQIVQSWYEAKPQIFGPPYDLDLVDQLATGNLYYNTTKDDGSVAWLRDNNFYYTYTTSEITDVEEFSNSGTRPYIKVRIFEELYLEGEQGIDKKNSGSYRGTFTYVFAQENGVWKIYDYNKVN
ncbi:ARC6/PARC6 family protein [Anabaenopsis tanganyikae CS-531]|uniref:ARC6/PARC6 family protein n=1 Tax=Anabaenopsis tanganyikae CS-531 TaxID=2785304 RepID=A0ABT6KES5_9CYAN|nr:ARC6/PARC6 family protein [Anabaenopsis tanganyikae]MDH6106192.1 ARC6/PARC6 family protein [Anabaenopsis tanganyikae CS-531]